MNKTIVIGLDGATFDLIEPWAKKGELPTFKRIMDEGCYGELKSTTPPITCPAWPSFYTGKNPGKHGAFNFVMQKDTPEPKLVDRWDVKADSLWKILAKKGKKCFVINVPVTYPAEKIENCNIVSGLLTPTISESTNSEEFEKVLRKIDGYIIEPDSKRILGKSELHENVRTAIKARTKLVKKIAEKNPDFIMVVYRGPDILQHRLWGDEKVLECYKQLDRIISEFLDVFSDYSIFIMSDHGFGPVSKRVNLYNILCKLGLVSYEEGTFVVEHERLFLAKRRQTNSLINVENISSVLKKLGLSWIGKYLPKKITKKIPRKRIDVNYGESKAYCNSKYGIKINLRGREKSSYEDLRKSIAKELNDLRDEENGKKVIEEVCSREELYQGGFVSDSPDLIVLSRPNYITAARKGAKTVEKLNYEIGEHRPNGILMCFGPAFRKMHEIKNAEIIDVAPTILHMYGVPVPDDMDGKVLKDMFKPGSGPAKRKIKYEKVSGKLEGVLGEIEI